MLPGDFTGEINFTFCPMNLRLLLVNFRPIIFKSAPAFNYQNAKIETQKNLYSVMKLVYIQIIVIGIWNCGNSFSSHKVYKDSDCVI